MKEEIQNAEIKSTMLGYEDHGILTWFLHLNFGGSGQGFGGYAMDSYSKTKEKRIPSEILGVHLQQILEVVGVEKWEDLEGKHVRIKREEGWNGKIIALGNFLEDKWFNPSDYVSH